MTDVRAVAIGIPDRLLEALGSIPGVVVTETLIRAMEVLDENPGAAVMYGEHLFGEAVSGQPVMLMDVQADPEVRWEPRIMVIIDHDPQQLDMLAWDDPRKLATQAAIRLKAGTLVDLSRDGIVGALSSRLDAFVDTPASGGYSQGNGNDDKSNGDPG